jgi:transcriptional regulator with XRE-family HTH domain
MNDPQDMERSGRRLRRRARKRGGGAWQVPAEGLDQEVNVGRNLRRLRRARKLSLRALAEMSDTSINTLSLIENSKTSPSVSTLQSIAKALDVNIVAFFEAESPIESAVLVKSDHGVRVPFSHGDFQDLGAGMANRPIVPLLVTLKPGSGSGSQPIVHTGQELVFCLSGRISYIIQNQVYELDQGDSLVFEAHLPHQWQNMGTTLARALLIICPADEKDVPEERHFALEDVW